MAFYCNNSLFFDNFFNIKKSKIVADYELELFEEGINNKNIFTSKKRDWKKEQFYLEKNEVKVVIVSNHFASTYRKEVFTQIQFQRPLFVFPGGELHFLDIPIDKLGYYRVSLPNAFAYHMGSTVKDKLISYKSENMPLIFSKNQKKIVHDSMFSFQYKVKEFVTRAVRKLHF
jgi:hypothetical protein